MVIKTPGEYISRPGAVEELGKAVLRTVSNGSPKAFLVWSETARDKYDTRVRQILNERSIRTAEGVLKGYPSIRQIRSIAELAEKEQADVLIGAGGGRVMDAVKAAGTYTGIPVITLPTIAATCAPWAAVSIIYTDEGDFHKFMDNPKSPAVILADTEIIGEAPVRYLRSGIVDTLAKWYEPVYEKETDFVTISAKNYAREAYLFLRDKGEQTVADLEKGKITDDAVKTVDAIIYLAGAVGSFTGRRVYSGFAHPYYHAARRIPAARKLLHGEQVAFGLLLQAVYEDRSDAEIRERLDILDRFQNLHDLEEAGFHTEEEIRTVAHRMLHTFFQRDDSAGEEKIVRTFRKTDSIVKQYREEKSDAST